MMFAIGVIGLLVGLGGMVLEFTGLGKAVPGFVGLNVPLMAWAVIFAIGLVLAMMSRRPSD